MLRSQKHDFVSVLEEVYKQSSSVIVTHYHGLTVAQITVLRKKLSQNGATFKVVKNTLSKIAANNIQLNVISELFKGPTAIAYSKDPVAAAKCVVEFAKVNKQLKIVGGIVNNQILDTESVEQLAKLPSLNELRSKIIGVINAPAVKIACVLQAPASQLARVLQAYASKD